MFSKTVDVYIWYLRKKLSRELIETKKWIGYIIAED
jgi:DNA-binding response OmpR family regulator